MILIRFAFLLERELSIGSFLKKELEHGITLLGVLKRFVQCLVLELILPCTIQDLKRSTEHLRCIVYCIEITSNGCQRMRERI